MKDNVQRVVVVLEVPADREIRPLIADLQSWLARWPATLFSWRRVHRPPLHTVRSTLRQHRELS